jgi:hypothetical protein
MWVVQPLNKLLSFYGTWFQYCTIRDHFIVQIFNLSSVISNDGCANFRNVSDTSTVGWGFRIFVWWWIWENTFINFCRFFYVKQHVYRVKCVRGLYTPVPNLCVSYTHTHPCRIFTNLSYTLTITNMLTALNLGSYGKICSCLEYVQVEVSTEMCR